ncbi:hypothetical protein [Adlercreutzia muris]|uniref:hypothetical protein n=1 Tax=Adlercreutzia muris TaxID=1796610 RepID=UPI003513906A
MTLRDVLKILKHYSVNAVAVICVCVFAAVGYYLTSADFWNPYSAKTSIVTSEPTGVLSSSGVQSLLESVARDTVADVDYDPDLISLTSDANSQEIVFSVRGPGAAEALEIANGLVDTTTESARATLRGIADSYQAGVAESESLIGGDPTEFAPGVSTADRIAALNSVYISVTNAFMAEDTRIKGFFKFCLVGVLGGAVAAICVVVLLDSLKRPIRDAQEAREVAKVPILSTNDRANFAERMLMDIQFLMPDGLESVCLLSLGSKQDVLDALHHSLSAGISCSVADSDEGAQDGIQRLSWGGVVVNICPSISCCTESARIANSCDATVIAVRLWSDSVDSLKKELQELDVARANLVGLIILGSE